jgi:hypothetical protein
LEPVKAQITFDAIAKKPEYINAAPEVQADVAYRFFEDNFASKPAYKRATPEVQADARARFMADYKVPSIELDEATEFQQAGPAMDMPDFSKPLAFAGSAFGSVVGDQARMLKGASLGHLDFTEPIDAFTQQQRQTAGLPQEMPFENIRQGIFELGGGAAPFIATEGLLGARGLLQGSSLLASMGREAGIGTALGALHRPEGPDMVNLPQRGMNALAWGAGGAALPLAGKVLKGGIKAVQSFGADTRPISAMGREQVEQQLQARIAESVQKQVMAQKVYQVRTQAVEAELQKLRAETGPIIQMQVDKKLAKIASGKVTPGELKRIQMFIKNAPRVGQSKKVSAVVEKAQAKQQVRAEQQHTQAEPKGNAEQTKTEQQTKGQKVGGKVTTRQGIKAEAAQAAKTGEFVEFDYSAEGGRSRLNEERIVREGTARDGRTEARQIGGESTHKQQGYRKEVVVEVKITKSGDTAMVTKNESGEFRTRIIEGKGQGSRVNWIKRTGEMPGPEYGTKEAIASAKMYSADRLAQIQKGLESLDVPEPVRKAFTRVMKTRKLSTMDYMQLNKHADDPKVKKLICDILGLTHG